jgi:hypothetical protein
MVAWTEAWDRDMGQVWLEVVGVKTGVSRTCLVVDLPHPKDKPALRRRGIVVELNYGSRGLCPRGWSGRARDCHVKIRRIVWTKKPPPPPPPVRRW